LYCDDRERESDRNIIFWCLFIGYFFLGFHIVVSGKVFLCWTMIQKRKNIKTHGNLIHTQGLRPLVQIRIVSCFDALSDAWLSFIFLMKLFSFISYFFREPHNIFD
jgi:hypothetical protein